VFSYSYAAEVILYIFQSLKCFVSYLVFGLVELSILEPYEVGNLSSQQRGIFKIRKGFPFDLFREGWEISSLYHYLVRIRRRWSQIFLKRLIIRDGST